jgi:non-ribosomal peptide synthetase component E (peptide arylation enzyme)
VTSRSAGDLLQQLATENPHVEVIRYHHKNVKWTLKHVNYFAEALAIGLLDNGLRAGDVVLSWLPNHFSEQVCSYDLLSASSHTA